MGDYWFEHTYRVGRTSFRDSIVERRKNKRLQNSYNPNATAYKGQNVYMGTPPTNGTAGPSYYPPNDYPTNPNTCKLD